MVSDGCISSKNKAPIKKKTDINILIQRAKLEQRKDTRTNVLYALAAMTVVAVFGLIISL